MNLLEFRDVLAERSAQLPAPELDRIEGVRRRVRQVRRRRVAVVAAAAVAVLLVVGYPALTRGSPHRAPQPAATGPGIRVIDGFPEYADGARLVGTAHGDLAMGSTVRLTIPGNSLGYSFASSCSVAGAYVSVLLSWQLNGVQLSSGTCGGPDGGGSVQTGGELSRYGIVDGQPAELTAQVVSATMHLTISPESPDHPEASGQTVLVPPGSITIAASVRIPVADYPFPPRPAQLRDLDRLDVWNVNDPAALVLSSDRADPLAPRSLTFTAAAGTELDAVAQTPGALRIELDGAPLTTAEYWDYLAGICAATVATGGTHTLTVYPERVTGEWRVVIHNGGQ